MVFPQGNRVNAHRSLIPLPSRLELGRPDVPLRLLLIGMTDMEILDLEKNNISDISAVADMNNLGDLSSSNNDIIDISPLSGLTDLYNLSLSNNNISDISALAGMTILDVLLLSTNNISDITPLVANEKIVRGDRVDIRNNTIDCDDPTTQHNIATLVARGVSLSHDCPN